SLSLIVHKQQTNIPELAKTPEVSNTSWAKQYSPDQPLANSTTITLEFKNPIQTDASGQPTSQWLSSVPVSIHPAELALSPLQPVIAPELKNTNLQNLSSGNYTFFYGQANNVNKNLEIAQRATREASTINVSNVDLISSQPLAIPNPQHQLVQLTLNPLLNQSVADFKISDLKVESPTKLSFSLESSDIKRLINAPIEITKTSSTGTSETQDTKATTNIVKIKPKLILQGAIGVPWSTIKKPAKFSKHLNLNDKWFESRIPKWSEKDAHLIKAQAFPEPGKNGRAAMINGNTYRSWVNINDPLFQLLTKDPSQDLSALSLKVFDPSGYLNQRLAKEGEQGKTPTPTTNLNLYSYQLNKTKEDKVRKGWTNVHPNQFVSPGENFKLTNDYLNIILNQPTKVTYYSASDFVNNLFNDPDKKPEEIQDKYTKTVKEKVGANAVDWGTAYLNFWYPKELIQQQSNIISANLTDLLFVNPDELTNNEKM
ncbi:hypothetical protein Q4495_03885, partial [Mesomycoplasma ovipneumoniae]